MLHKLSLMKRALKPFPLKSKVMEHPPMFVVGSGRSGNTLMRAMLVAQGDFVIPPESYVLGSLIKEYQLFNFLPWRILSRLVIAKFNSHPEFPTWEVDLTPVYTGALELSNDQRNLASLIEYIYHSYGEQNLDGGSRWGDKTPMNVFYLDEINEVFPNAQYIHMIRDGRDVVSSYLKAGIYTDLEDACHRWAESINLVRSFAKNIPAQCYMEVRYEELVSDPEAVVMSICEFLDLEFNDDMLKPEKFASLLGDTGRPHHGGVHRPITTDSIGKWKTGLSSEQQEKVMSILKEKLSQLGYIETEAE